MWYLIDQWYWALVSSIDPAMIIPSFGYWEYLLINMPADQFRWGTFPYTKVADSLMSRFSSSSRELEQPYSGRVQIPERLDRATSVVVPDGGSPHGEIWTQTGELLWMLLLAGYREMPPRHCESRSTVQTLWSVHWSKLRVMFLSDWWQFTGTYRQFSWFVLSLWGNLDCKTIFGYCRHIGKRECVKLVRVRVPGRQDCITFSVTQVSSRFV